MKIPYFILSKIPSNNRMERIWKLGQVDFKKRYYNDRLGLLWALIKPVFEAGIYFFVFKQVLKTEIPNFALFIFLALILWTLFVESTKTGTHLLHAKRYLIENIQFNRFDLYISHMISGLIGFVFNFLAFMIIFLLLGIELKSSFLLFPIIVIQMVILSLAATLILSNLQPFVKDINHLWDMVLLAGLFGSGIFYDPKIVIKMFDFSLYCNPFLGIMHNARASVLGTYDFQIDYLIINSVQALILLLIGLFITKKFGPLAIEKL